MKNRWIPSLLTVCVISLSSLQATIILDEVMSQDEQKKTGIDRLSRHQKLAFEAWLNQTFILKTEAEKSESSPLSLSINIDHGHKLQLSDNSIWEIDPADKNTAAGWITPIPVKIGSSKNSAYPYLLINATSGVSVKARIPQHTPPPPHPVPAPQPSGTMTPAPEATPQSPESQPAQPAMKP